jgi:DNA-binding response OmpR family regulator
MTAVAGSPARILIADDDLVSRRLVQVTLVNWGYEVVVTSDGTEAWQALTAPDAPPLAILDWMMPGLDGRELCYRIRERGAVEPTYIILLTAKSEKEDIAVGLEAGADDYLTKPFDRVELRARVRAGLRVLELQRQLAARVRELEESLAQAKLLRGIIHMCYDCKKVRAGRDEWQPVDLYLTRHTEARFTQGLCPECHATRHERSSG